MLQPESDVYSMRTIAQRKSSRLNALKSTGPRTPEGKARSAMNAFKIGIHAQSAVVPGESSAEYAALTAEYNTYNCPATGPQHVLVDTLVACEWQRRRMVHLEPKVWDEQTNRNGAPGQQLTRLHRRLDALHWRYLAALKELAVLQRCDQEISTVHAAVEKPLNSSSASFRPRGSKVLLETQRHAI